MENDLQETKREIVDKIKNSMTDRCAAHHAVLQIVCSHWKKALNELNCHLHPLDSFASASRAALKTLEQRKESLLGVNAFLQISFCKSISCDIKTARGTHVASFPFWRSIIFYAVFFGDTEETAFMSCTQQALFLLKITICSSIFSNRERLVEACGGPSCRTSQTKLQNWNCAF